MHRKTQQLSFIIAGLIALSATLLPVFASNENKNYPCNSTKVVTYAKGLLNSIVDTNFRGSWVVDPDNVEKMKKDTKKMQKIISGLGSINIGDTPRDVRKMLSTPIVKKNKGKIWIYGEKNEDGSFEGLYQVFFDDNLQAVTGIISFNEEDVDEEIGISIGDPIESIIDQYGEPVDEKDYIEDPDNKHYLGMYYLYPRSGVGFLIGQNSGSEDLSVKGVIVFGKG